MDLDKKIYRAAEERIRNYYKKDKKIKSINDKIKVLKNQISILSCRIKNNDFDIDLNLNGMSLSEKVQVSNIESPIEKSMIKCIEKMESKIAKNIEEINYLELLIMNIEEDFKIIEYNIENSLKEEEKKFLEETYKNCLSNWKLSNKYHMSESSCTRRKKTLIMQIIKWEEEAMGGCSIMEFK